MNQFDYRAPLGWSELPNPAACDGHTVTVSDVGASKFGVEFAASAGEWRPSSGKLVLANGTSYPAESLDGPQTAASVSVPANLLGSAGSLRVFAVFESVRSTEEMQVIYLKLASQQLYAGSIGPSCKLVVDVTLHAGFVGDTQLFVISQPAADADVQTTAIDLSVDNVLEVQTQLTATGAAAEEVIYLRVLTVELTK